MMYLFHDVFTLLYNYVLGLSFRVCCIVCCVGFNFVVNNYWLLSCALLVAHLFPASSYKELRSCGLVCAWSKYCYLFQYQVRKRGRKGRSTLRMLALRVSSSPPTVNVHEFP